MPLGDVGVARLGARGGLRRTSSNATRVHRGMFAVSTLVRVSFVGLVVGALAAVVVWGLSETAPPAQSAQAARCVTVTVKPGDTLWSIARGVSNGQSDLRILTHRIKELNSLNSARITPGQSLTVPLDL